MSTHTLLLLSPLIAIDLGLIIFSLYDLTRPDRRVHGSKWVWAAVILFVSTFGPLIYLLVGREEE